MSQKDRIREALLKGEKLTRIEAQQKYGVARLSARIDDLDSELNIVRGWRKVPTRWDNASTRIREYYLG